MGDPGQSVVMATQGTRRLAAVIAADVVGYSRMMGEDEDATLAALRHHRAEFIDPLIAAHDGRIVKTLGDGFLLEFTSVVNAVRWAVALQEGMAARQPDTPADKRIVFRIGVNIGDVVVDSDGDIFGDGVNIAARLEGMADPGGVLISHWARQSIADRLDLEFFDNGERKFKNIARPIRVWSWPQRLAGLRAEDKPHVFVADFEGRGSEDERLAGDFSDELGAHLARLTGVEVTSDRAKAHYVIEGSLRLASTRSRVFARLIAVEDGSQIWSDRYDEPTSDALDILDRCAPKISMSVRRQIAADHANRAAQRPLDELSFEQLLAVAGCSFFTPTRDGWYRGGVMAEQALQLAPDHFMALAMAAAGLGLVETLYGFRKTDEATLALAFKRVEQALRVTNRSDMVNIVHGGLLLYGRRRYGEAAAASRRALELNSDYNMGYWSLGSVQIFSGDYDAGTESASRAVEIDVRDPYVHLYSRIVAYGHLGAGRHSEAVEWFQRADHLAPGLVPNRIGLAVSRWLEGDEDGARGSVARLVEDEPNFRMSEMHPLPFRDERIWTQFIEALRHAGAPE